MGVKRHATVAAARESPYTHTQHPVSVAAVILPPNKVIYWVSFFHLLYFLSLLFKLSSVMENKSNNDVFHKTPFTRSFYIRVCTL